MRRTAIIAGTTCSIGGLALLLGLLYLTHWCRKRRKNRVSVASVEPMWPKCAGGESFGNILPSHSRARSFDALSVPMPSPPLRRGHASGMDMVQVSDDPFGATPPASMFLGSTSPPPPSTPGTPGLVNPFDSVYGAMLDSGTHTPNSTTQLVHPEADMLSRPAWAARALPVPVIRVQSPSTEDYSNDAVSRSSYSRSARSSYAPSHSSYAESIVPLETPAEERYIRNPFADPPEYSSTETVSTVLHSPASGGAKDADRTVLKDNSSQARLAAHTSRLTMQSFQADVVPSPVDAIDRFWDIPTPSTVDARFSAGTPSSSETFLRSMSPGPRASTREW